MKKLNKEQNKTFEGVTSDLATAFGDLQEACETYNSASAEQKDVSKVAVEAAIVEYNNKLSEVRSFCEEIVAAIREYFDGKSEKWQEGEKGQAYEAWIEEWETDLDDISWVNLATESKTGAGVVLDTSDMEDYSESVSSYSIELA